MEGMREIANAYYQRSNDMEKEKVPEFFSKLDIDSDGKVSLADFHKALQTSFICKDDVFRQLDVNEDGYLNFGDSIVLYYMETIGMCRCDGCSACLYGMYFSCKQCIEKGYPSFDLCCDCYRKGVAHNHSTPDMLDYHSLVHLLRTRTTAQINRQTQMKLEGMREIANAYYQRSDDMEKKKVQIFFNKLDTNRDGKVSHTDVEQLFQQSSISNVDIIFQQLDVNQDGYLNFPESIVLYYMKMIGMYICNGCRASLYGMHFSCKQCLGMGSDCFDLCRDCYIKGVDHHHSITDMLDYHSLVRLLKRRTTAEENGQSQRKMEGMREIANAYYQRSDEVEKKEVREFFNKLDTDGDGKVSLSDFKKGLSEDDLPEDDFQQFDINQDGYLSLSDSIVLYYLLKIGRYICSGCSGSLYGMHFSCEQCLGKGNNTFDLCCDCYIKGVDHHHSTTDLLDSHSLFRLLVKRTTAEENGQSQRKREMEQLQEIAMVYFNAGSKDVKALARKFYESMDIDGNGSVGVRRFLTFMKQEGYSEMSKKKIFYDISDGGDSLSFENGMTLYYIIKSGRPICNGCYKLIPGIYFSCIKCVASPKRAFNLCKPCYKERKCTHSHDGQDAPLYDNYTLLQFMMNTSPSSVSDTAVTGKSYESTPSSSQAG